MGTSTKRYQWFFFATLVFTLYYQAGYSQSGSFGSTYVHTGGEMAIFGQHNFQSGSGTINAGIIGSERKPIIGLYSFVPPNGSWINASNNAFVDGYVRTYRSDGFTFPIGDNNVYRPAAVSAAGSSSATAATAAYFGVDPSSAVTSDLKGGNYGALPAGGPFPTSAVATPNLKVDNVEYWDIDGSTAAKITLTWDSRTPINTMTNGVLSTLTIVGWNPATSKWEAIPSVFDVTSLAQNTSSSSFTGPTSTTASGSITTLAAVVPNTYTVYTLAGTANTCPTITNVATNNINPSTCGGADGSIVICGVTAATSYSIAFSKNGVAQAGFTQTANTSGCLSLTGLTAGIYSAVQVFNATCTTGSNALGPITLSDPGSPSAPTLTLSPASGSLCAGQSLTLTASGATGSTFIFSGPGLAATTGNSVVATPPGTGTAVYTVTQNVAGCTSPAASQTVTVNAQPAISNIVSTQPTSCSGTDGSLGLYGLSASTSYTISYSYNGGAAITRTVVTDASGVASLTGLRAGTYSITAGNNGCSSAAQTASLSDPGSPSGPTLSLNPFSGSVCLGQSLTLTASGASGATFTFSGPSLSASNGNSAVATPTTVGNAVYMVSQTVAGCTSPMASQTVTVTAQPAVSSITPTNPTSCSGTNGSLALNGLSPSTPYTVSYTYNGVSATQAIVANASGIASLTGLSAGSYSNIIAGANGCSSAPQTATLSDPASPVPPVLTLTPGSGTICQGQSLTLTASGATGATYTFSGPGLSSTTGPIVTATPTSIGNAVYTVTQSASGCTSTPATYTVTVNNPPTISSVTPTNPSSCSGANGSLALNGLSPNTVYTVSYVVNGGAPATRNILSDASGVASLTGLQAGAYTNIVASNNSGCSSIAQTATLSDPGAPTTPTFTLNPASGTLCLGQSLTLTASGSASATFTFSGPGLGSSTGSNAVATPTSVGNAVYTVTQSVSGCTSSAASQTVVVGAQPTISSITPTNPNTCATSTGSISLNGLAPSSTFTVSYNKNGGSTITATLTSNGTGQVVLNGLGAGNYTNIMVAQGGCMSAPSSGTVTLVDPTPSPLTAAQVGGINPTSCGSATGRIDITGLPVNTGGIIIGYAKNGTATTATVTTDAAGKASILNLTSGTYTNFTVQIGACTSAPYAGPVSISDPGLPALTAANIASTNPTSCGNNDGRITLSGLPASINLTITYQVSGTAASASVTTNASGQAFIPNLTAGNYSVIAYTIGACTSAPYNGTVVINDPGITPLTAANVTGQAPTYCGAVNGQINFTGLASNQSLVINYKKDGAAQAPVTVITDAAGKAFIGSLGQGVYSDFTYSIGSCTSPVYAGPVDLQHPNLTASQVTGYNPAICGANSGRIEVTGLASNQSITINFTQNGVQQAIPATSDATGKAIVTGLFSGTYTNFSYSQGACTSTVYPGPIILNNSAPAVLSSANVLGINPTRCGQSDGRIEITGLAGSTSTTINYKQNGVVRVANITTDASGKATINSLTAGTYSDFTYTQGTCTSAPYTGPVTLADPTPTPLTTANVASFNPTSCSATDGRIEITGLASNISTVISYQKNGTVTNTTVTSDASGKVTIPNIGIGTYTAFSYTQGACTSTPFTGSLVVNGVNCNQNPPLVVGKPLVTSVNTPGSVCLPVSDPDGTTNFTVSVCGQPTNGTVSVPGSSFTGNQLCLTYTPPTGFTGNAGTACVVVTDPTGLTSVAYVPIVVTPISGTTTTQQPPVVTVVPITTPINTTATVCLPVSDPNGTTSFTAAICGQPANGTAVVANTNANSVCINYTPPTSFTGNAGNVCVVVTDPTGLTTTVQVPVTVTPDPTTPGIQHPPVVIPAPIVTLVNQPGNICLPLSDPDGTASFTTAICGQPTNGTATIVSTSANNVCLSYTPPTGFTGNAGNICVIVTDPTGLTTTAQVPVTVYPTTAQPQRPPVITGQPLVTNVNQPGSVCLPVSDPDGTTSFTAAICGQPANGVVSVPPTVNGNQVCVSYTPPANFTGNAGTACVVITDPTGLTSVAYVPIVVNPISGTAPTGQPPVVTVIPITTPVNTTATVCLPVTDPNGTTSFTAAICGQPTNGTATVVSTGTATVCIKYTPPTNFTGSAGNVCVVVTDPTGLTTTVQVPVTIIPDPTTSGNQHPPVVIGAPLVTNQNQPGSVCLPVTDPDGTTAFTVTACGLPTSGTASFPITVNGNSLCITYTPPTNFSGNAGTLCLIVTDPTGLTSVAYVPVTVIPTNQPTQRPPVIVGQPLVTTVNQPGSVCLPVSDPDGSTSFTAAICGQPTNGIASVPATVNGNQLCVSYTPPANFTGNAGTVCVIVTDPTGLTSVAYVPVVVTPISGTTTTQQPPVVTVVPITTPINTTATVCLPISDPNGTTSFTAAICGQPTNGTATLVSTGTATVCIKYTPPANFTGNAGNICVVVTDPTGLTSTVQVPVTVIPSPTIDPGVQHPPVVVPAPIVTLVNQPGNLCLPLSDPDGTTSFTTAICGQPTNGTAAIVSTNANSVCLNYTPPANFTGSAGNICVIVTDPTGLTSTALVPVTVYPTTAPTQHPPAITGQPIVTSVNTPNSVCLPVSDADGTTSFTATICGQPANGSVAIVSSGTATASACLSYTPPTNFTGNAGTACIIVTDPTGLTSVVYVPIVVTPISGTAPTGQPPVVTIVPITTPVNQTATVCLPVSDPNGTTSFTAAICGQPTNGTAVVVSTSTNSVCIKYTPPTNFTGNAGNVCVVVTDPTGLTTTVQVPVTVTPDPTAPGNQHPPVVVPSPLVTKQGQPGSVCLPVTDPDGTNSYTVTVCGQPSSGTTIVPATLVGNSLCISYTPTSSFTGNAGNICLVVTDPTGLSTTALVPVTVIPANVPTSTQRPPVIIGQPLVTNMNTPSSVCLPVSDPDGTTSFTVAICGQPANGSATVPNLVNGNQVCVSYTPPTNFTGNAGTVCVIVTDPTGLTSVAYIPVVVNPMSGTAIDPKPPVVTVVPITTPINTTATVCLPIMDPNGTTSFTTAICGQPTNGTATVVSTGTATVCIKYTPPTNFTGNAGNVCVVITDPTGLTTTVQVPVTVIPDPTPNPSVPHPPVVIGAPLVTNQNQPGSVCLPVTDPDGTTNFTVSICGQPSSGTTSYPTTVNGNSLCINYTPTPNFSGNAGTLCLIVTDPTGLTSVAYVPVTVVPGNQQRPPVVTGLPLVTSVNTPGSVCLPVVDPDGTTSFTAAICGQPTSGTASIPATVNGSQLCVSYTPPANFTGNAGTVCVIVTDPTGLTSVAYVPIVVTPISGTTTTQQPPVVTVVPITTPINTTATVCLPVSDPNGTTSFTAAICGQPTNGTAVVVSTGANSVCIKYTPPTSFTGNAGNVCVVVTDPTGLTTVVTVPVTVTPDPTIPGNQHPPIVIPAPIVTLVNQPGSVCLPIGDLDGPTNLTVSICGQPTYGTATIVSANANSLCLSYTPPTGFTGNAGNVCVIVTDPTGLSTTALVPVTVIPTNGPVQHPPVVIGQPLVTMVNQPGSVCLPAFDSDGTTSFTAAICGQPANGVASIPGSFTGNQICISYTPPANFTGNAGTVCVIVTDPTGLTSVAYVPVVVTPISTTTTVTLPPIVTVVPITTPVNQTVVTCLPISSPNGTTSFTASICGQPTSGTVSVTSTNANSVCVKYTPPTNFTGSAGNVCLIITDPTGQTTVVTVPVTVTPIPTVNPSIPHPPVVIPAPIVTKQGQPGSVCLPVTDPDGTTSFTVTVCGQPMSGTAVVPNTVNNGVLCISYMPVNSFSGNAGNVCLIVTDPTGLSTTALVPVTVVPTNQPTQHPPVVVGQPLVTTVNQPGSVCLPVFDGDGTTSFTAAICGQPANGVASVPATVNGSQLCVNYTPPTNFTGNAGTVCVIVTDPTGLTSVAYVPVVVTPISGTTTITLPPVVTIVPITTPINQTVVACQPVNSPNGATSFTAAICGQPTNGTVAVVSTSANSVCVKYTPPTGFTGNAGNVCVIVTDPTGQTTVVTVPITVTPDPTTGPQHPPIVVPAPIVTKQGQPGSVCLPVTDPDGTTAFTVSLCGQPTSGTISYPTTMNNGILCVNYTPPASFTGNAGNVCLIVTDPTGLTTTVFVPVTVIPTSVTTITQYPPIITGQPLVTNENTPGSVCLPVVDPNGTTSFTAAICGQPNSGTASIPATFTGNQVCINYTPPTSFTGYAGTVCVIITDPTGLTSTVQVPVIVSPVCTTTTSPQLPPVVVITPIVTPKETPITVCMPVSSPNGATSFSVSICNQPASGTATVVSSGTGNVCIRYTPPASFTGYAGNVCVTVTEPTGLSTVIQVPVVVTPVCMCPVPPPHPPVIVGAPLVTNQNQPGRVCLPVSDPDGTNNFTITVCGLPNAGTATVPSTLVGNLLCIDYTPANGFSGNAGTLCLIVTDPTGLTATALVPITVIPTIVPHPPVIGPGSVTTPINTTAQICLPLSDPDGTSSYTIAICGQPTSGTVSAPTTVVGNQVCITYTPPTNFTGNAGSFCIKVTDPTGLTTTQTVSVSVVPASAACVTINLKVFLEGPYNSSTHLMNTTLNQRGLLPGQIPVGGFAVATPAGQPYNTAPWNYTGTESVTTYAQDIVDWVLVTLRTDSLTTQSTFRAAGLLHNDGRITFVNPCFTIPTGNYFAVIEHRNHMGVMSPRRVNVTSNVLNFDFTQQDSYLITNPPSFGEIQIDGRWMMYGGDGKKDIYTDNFDINFFDSKLWKDESGIFDQYRYGDFNMDADVNFSDSVLWNKNNGRYSKVPH